MEFISRAPVWVWPLLLVMVFIGVRSMRPREVPVALLCMLPFLVLLALRSVAAIAPGAAVWGIFAACWAVSVAFGIRFARTWVIERVGAKVHVRGEYVTLITVMVLYWANFAAGVLQAVAPDILQSFVGGAVFAATLGLASGQFAGRTYAALRS